MIRMKSKLHGFCHAHNKNEEDYLRKLGWIEESESFSDEVAQPAEQQEEPKAEAQATEATPNPDKPRRGRKPKAEA